MFGSSGRVFLFFPHLIRISISGCDFHGFMDESEALWLDYVPGTE